MTVCILSKIDWDRYKYFNFAFSISYAIWLVLYSGMREPGSSADDINYLLNLTYGGSGFEIIFSEITKIFRFYNSTPESYFLFISILSMTILILSLLKCNVKYLSFALLIYSSHVFLYRDMIQIRAAVAYNLVLLSFVLFSNKKLMLSLISYLTSIGFHKSSIASVIVIFLNSFFIRTSTVVITCMLIYLSSFFDLGGYIIRNVGYLSGFVSEAILDTYLVEGEEYAQKLSALNPTTLKILVIFLILSYHRDRIDFIRNNNIYYYSYAMSFVFITLFSSFNVFASRMSSLFSVVEVVLIPAIILHTKNKLLIVGLIFMYLAQLSLNIFGKNLDTGGFLYLL